MLAWPESLFSTEQRDTIKMIKDSFNTIRLAARLEEPHHGIQRAAKAPGWKDDTTFRQEGEQTRLGPMSGQR